MHSDFRRVQTRIVRFIRCRKSGYVFRKAGTSKAKFDASGHATFRIKRPRTTLAFYAARVTFGGT